jgi:6-phosphogluconolactonase
MRISALLGLSLAALAAGCSDQSDLNAPSAGDELSRQRDQSSSNGPGAVYVLSNDAAANAVLVFPRGEDGGLRTPAAVPTGGRGTGTGLGNAGAIALDPRTGRLYAVDAGSDEISAFNVVAGTLQPIGRIGSGGDEPISLALHDDLLYVLNDGTTANITGFRVGSSGSLTPLPGSTRGRSVPAGARDGAQIGFTPDGRALLVTEKAANILVSYRVLHDGRTAEPVVTPSSGPTPFGFDFDPKGLAVVSEAGGGPGGSSVSSYDVEGQARLRLISGSVGTGQSAACWIAVMSDGRFAYSANTGSGTVTGFSVARNGRLQILSAGGATGTTGAGSGPADLDFSTGSRFLYVRNGGNNTISVFSVGEDGSLTPVATVAGLPPGTTGLAAS